MYPDGDTQEMGQGGVDASTVSWDYVVALLVVVVAEELGLWVWFGQSSLDHS